MVFSFVFCWVNLTVDRGQICPQPHTCRRRREDWEREGRKGEIVSTRTGRIAKVIRNGRDKETDDDRSSDTCRTIPPLVEGLLSRKSLVTLNVGEPEFLKVRLPYSVNRTIQWRIDSISYHSDTRDIVYYLCFGPLYGPQTRLWASESKSRNRYVFIILTQTSLFHLPYLRLQPMGLLRCVVKLSMTCRFLSMTTVIPVWCLVPGFQRGLLEKKFWGVSEYVL